MIAAVRLWSGPCSDSDKIKGAVPLALFHSKREAWVWMLDPQGSIGTFEAIDAIEVDVTVSGEDVDIK